MTARGNLTTDPTTGKTYGYASQNLLTSASGGITLGYDPHMRLYQVTGGATTRFAYDGLAMIAEYNGSNSLQRRFVHGPGIDQPLVQYEGTGTTDRRFFQADERGSIIAITDGSGTVLTTNRYDEYGKPQTTNSGRFQYTGQMWLAELGGYYFKARIYAPHLGRFLQTDPIGYEAGPNLYTYVGNDPVNLVDPLGQNGCSPLADVCGVEPRTEDPDRSPLLLLAGLGIVPDPNREGGDRACQPYEESEACVIFVMASKRKVSSPVVITPSLDPFTFYNHFLHGSGETICLSSEQFFNIVDTGRILGSFNPNGANLVSFYETALENTFGSSTIIFRRGLPKEFRDTYDFNIGGASRTLEGQVKTILGGALGVGGTPFKVKYPC